jgi:DNA-binding helix-hairpin-helix protein with protein kinase domain
MQVTLTDSTAIECEDEPFSAGADGAAYWSRDKRQLVKLYHRPDPAREQILKEIVGRFNAVRGEPYWEGFFAWPLGVVTAPRLGVVLPRAHGKPLNRFVTPRWLKYHPEDVGTFQGRLGVASGLARAVRRLHFKGLCHSDLSENNVFADAQTGAMTVIDCDSLVVPGRARAIVLGTPGNLAPELLIGAVREPSVETEKHALAVLIYRTLLVRHPLDGRKVHDRDPDRDEHLRMGERALFIEHPTDPSNRPEKMSFSCDTLGPAVKRLIYRAFVDGLHQPEKRPQPSDWERDLHNLSDTLVNCSNGNCVWKQFPLVDATAKAAKVRCPWCNSPLRGDAFPMLRWAAPSAGQAGVYRPDGLRKVIRNDGTLHEWDLRSATVPGPRFRTEPLASFQAVRDRNGHLRWVLLNQNLPCLQVADPQGPWVRIRSNEAVELKENRTLCFGIPGQDRVALVELVKPT